MRKFLILICTILIIMPLIPSGNIAASANFNIIEKDVQEDNITIEKDGVLYEYNPDGELVYSASIMSEDDLEEYNQNIINETIMTIESEIDTDYELKAYYRQLVEQGVEYTDMMELIQKKKTEDKPSLDNETIEKNRKNKKIKDKGMSVSHTYGFAPTTMGANWVEVIHDGFEDNQLGDWNKYDSPNGESNIVSGSSDCGQSEDGDYRLRLRATASDGGRAQVRSFPLDIYTGSSGEAYSNLFYKISMDFCLDETDAGHNRYTYLILNHQINVVIVGNDIRYTYKSGNPPTNHEATLYGALSEKTWYHIEAIYDVDASEYDLILREQDLDWITSDSNIDNYLDDAINFLKIGDDEIGSTNYVDMSFDNIVVSGHHKGKFYENFDYGFWYDWRAMANDGQTIKVLDDGFLKIDSTNMALAPSGYIDYDSGNDYSMTIYFKMIDEGQNVMRLIDNGQICINLYSSRQLKYYSGSPQPITTLTLDDWYYVHVDVYPTASPPRYDIWVNNPQEIGNPTVSTTNFCGSARNFIRIGSGPGEYGNIQVKYFKLLGGITTDGENIPDGISNTFEDNPRSQMFGDDFEVIWANENSYDSLWIGTPWEREEPSNGPSEGAADSKKCYGTDLDSNYVGNSNSKLKTPMIYVGNVPSTKNIELLIDHWYKTQDGVDGGRVSVGQYENWDRTGSGDLNQIDPDNPPASYKSVSELSNANGFTGDSGGWRYLEKFTIVPADWYNVNRPYIYFEFEFDSDNTIHNNGWYIDNIKLYGPTDSTDSDTDNDGLNDGTDYYIWGASPLRSDSDEDGLSDYEEATLDHLNQITISKGRAIPGVPDIFIEVDHMNGKSLDTGARNYIVSKFKEKMITLHFVTLGINTDQLLGDGTAEDSEFLDCYTTWHNNDFTNNFEGEYHYLCLATFHIDSHGTLGIANTPGDDFVVYDSACDTCDNPNDVGQGYTLMHELGHNFDFRHGDGGVMAQGCGPDTHSYNYNDVSWQDLDFGSGNDISSTEHT